ncbi:MAG: hypothetical protein HKO95_16580 [Rhodobacteraceae bacterium]|nr:hypothetical protein [Alphaproteobacteria bacterium]MBT8476778.1 hypothetical protein [Alphaproteobacteria bacterium]NNF73454.1 hypothetical protein [Paracoccaceae bacterium]NNK68342.1 hypothetical protein [Paracoccaceae bacterium]RZV99104.1 MAG: hypothetical protein EX266_15845 [Paracoccaceae bacterium]
MDDQISRITRQDRLTDRDFRFATAQYGLYAERVTELQKEREVWIRHSILATFAFFGWIAVYRDSVTATFMLQMVSLQTIYFVPLVFNLGGALRFFFIQRDINRLVRFLAEMERDVLCLPDEICEAPNGRGIRDRHWHWPTICYWMFITTLSAAAGLVLSLGITL